FDQNGDGTIDRSELGAVLEALDGRNWPSVRLDRLLREVDTNLDGRIQYEEFTTWLFTSGSKQADFCRSVEKIALSAVEEVRAAEALREMATSSPKEWKAAVELLQQRLQQLLVDPSNLALRRVQPDSGLVSALRAVRGGMRLLTAAGFREPPTSLLEKAKSLVTGSELVLPEGVDIRWLAVRLEQAISQEGDAGGEVRAEHASAAENTKVAFLEELKAGPLGTKEAFLDEPKVASKDGPENPKWELFGETRPDIAQLLETLKALPHMDKKTMSGKCTQQTIAMEDFMMEQVGMRELQDQYFVSGVKAFELQQSLAELPAETELLYKGSNQEGRQFRMSVAEVLEWQSTFRTFYAPDVYEGEEGKLILRKSLEGQSGPGQEAWKMKFAIRCSRNPVIMRFDGKVVDRKVGEAASGNIYLISVCGIDFASRLHDHMDLTEYIKNWQEVYAFDQDDFPKVRHGRDFVPTGVAAKLNVSKCLFDLKKMARLRLRAQDALGIQVVVEVGLGLGVFAGDAIGIGSNVRKLSALALRRVLEEEKFKSIKLVVLSLPIFRAGDNFEYYSKVFAPEGSAYVSRDDSAYDGATPVLLVDQDMHALALAAASLGFVAGELNPADSHGIFGEYWQNFGPGTEEKLALTTCGLLTQHH
ncbi:unnamed protein product, partial [Polarella glacialis]